MNVPVGTIVPWLCVSPTPEPPPGWLLCDRSPVSRSTYAALFAAIGTTYGAGDGSTTFQLPGGDGRFFWGSSEAWGGSNLSHSSTLYGSNSANQDTRPSHYDLGFAYGNVANAISQPASGNHGHSFAAGSVNSGALPDGTNNVGSHGGASGNSGGPSANVARDTGNLNYLARPDHTHSWSTGAVGHGAHNSGDHTINTASVGEAGGHNHNTATAVFEVSATAGTIGVPHVRLYHLIRY